MRVLSAVKPTPEQLPILADAGAGFRLIRGAAGSGKTTVALLRLRQLCRSRRSRNERLGLSDPVRVLVLTFNRTLRGYIDQLAEDTVKSSQHVDLRVDTFGRWAQSIAGPANILDDQRRQDLIRNLLREVNVAVVRDNLPYFVDEVEYVNGRFEPTNRAEYLDMERKGRGRNPPVVRSTRERLLSQVITAYEKRKAQKGWWDWNDLAVATAQKKNRQYDVVIVDETQDLSANQMRAILSHLNEDHVTTFVMDAMQRIYPQAFNWRDIGIEMRPNMVFSLSANHRNTVQIARFAQSLVSDLPPDDDGVVPDPTSCSREGSVPRILSGRYSEQIKHMLAYMESALARDETFAILHPLGGHWFRYTRQELDKRSISYCDLTRARDWPSGDELVALSTIHSAKGLEFDHVLMPGLNREVILRRDHDESSEQLRRLVAMGVGRARQSVTLGYKPSDRSQIIDVIDSTTYEQVEV